MDELFMALLLTSEAVGDFPERVEVPRARLAGRAGAPALEFDARNAHRPPISRQPSEIESEEGGRGHVSRESEGEAGGTPGR